MKQTPRDRCRRLKVQMRGSNPNRWMVEITYRDGSSPAVFAIEEIEDLSEIVETGPDWNTIAEIVIVLNTPTLRPALEAECRPLQP